VASPVELTQQVIEAFNTRDPDTIIELADSRFAIDWSRSIGPNQGVYDGADGVREFVEDQWAIFEEIRIESEGYLPRGGSVVVPLTVHGRGRDGIPLSASSALLFTFEEERLVRMTMYQNGDEAVAAVSER
jgi:hypothetical protein